MYSAYKVIERFGKMRRIPVLTLCIFAVMAMLYFKAAGAEESSPQKPSSGEVTLEDLKPEPLGDLFAIKLLEKIIELEDAFKFLAKEVGQMNEKLTKRIDEIDKRLTKLEKAPPAFTPGTGEPFKPPPPPQKRFEVGDLYLGSGFKAHNVVYETNEMGTAFTGDIENDSSAPIEWAEFEITVYGEDDKLMGAKRFKVNDLGLGESISFDEIVKGPEAHWIKRYEIQFLRRS